MDKCVVCSSSRVVQGECRLRDEVGPCAKVFRPWSCVVTTSFIMYAPDVPIDSNGTFCACLDCGLVWAKINQEALSKDIKKYAEPEELERLKLA